MNYADLYQEQSEARVALGEAFAAGGLESAGVKAARRKAAEAAVKAEQARAFEDAVEAHLAKNSDDADEAESK